MPPVAFAPLPARVEIFLPPNPGTGTRLNNGGARLAVVVQPNTAIVRVGLWDGAWTAGGALRDGASPITSFIDEDTRCFHFRVFDNVAHNNGAATVQVRWRTRHTDAVPPTDDDAAAPLTLTAVAGSDGYYVSRAVMLVTDAADRATAHDGGYGIGEARLRRITVSDAHPLTSEVYVEYTPAAGGLDVTAAAAVFDHAGGQPGSRKRLRVHLVDVRDAPAGNATLTGPRSNGVKEAFQSIYAVCGVFAEVDTFAVDPPPSCMGWPGAYGAQSSNGYAVLDPSVELSTEGFLPGGLPMVTPSQSERDLVAVVRATAGYAANDVYVLFVNALYTAPIPAANALPLATLTEEAGGEAFPDSQTDPLHPAALGFALIALNGVPPYSVVHEVTHLTTDFNNPADGHFELGGAAAVAPTGRTSRNLMHRFNLVAAGDHLDPKRLWDAGEYNGIWIPNFAVPAQVTAIRGSRFVQAY
jgi:hypothetical protein